MRQLQKNLGYLAFTYQNILLIYKTIQKSVDKTDTFALKLYSKCKCIYYSAVMSDHFNVCGMHFNDTLSFLSNMWQTGKFI